MQGADEQAVLAAAAALQAQSAHPLAHAVLDAARARGISPVTDAAHDVQAVTGKGTLGTVQGVTLALGSLRWMQELGVPLEASGPLTLSLQRQQAAGASVSLLASRGGEGQAWSPLALLAFGDEAKPGAREALARLKDRGLRLFMVSGDHRGAAETMARALGMDVQGGAVIADVLPGDKAAVVAQLKANGHVVSMVGDGVNDAPALAAADVGMAMSHTQGGNADVAMHAAGITLMRGDPMLVEAALDISRRTVAKIRQNLFWAFAYNAAGIPLAALGYLSPVLAGAAMALSSVSVMGNALLLKRWKPGR